MRKKRTLKASDVYREKEFVFGKKVSFEKAFPTIEDVQVEVEEDGYGPGSRQGIFGPYKYSLPHIGEYIDCSNPICYNGGFRIREILRQMVREKQADLETSKRCQGDEGSPQGRRKYRECMNYFKIKVHIKYKKPEEEKEEGG